MNKTDNRSNSSQPLPALLWTCGQATTGVVTATELYLLFALLVHAYRNYKLKKTNKRLITVFAILTPALHLVNILVTELQILTPSSTALQRYPHTCDLLVALKPVTFFLATLPSYLFFWHRQRTLYRSKALVRLNNRCVRILNVASIAAIVAGGLVGLALNEAFFRRHLRLTGAGCMFADHNAPTYYLNSLTGAVFVAATSTMFALFVYPLRKHRGASSASRIARRAVFKATGSLAVCIVSDVLAPLVVVLLFPPTWPRYTTSVVYDVASMCNSAAVVLSYDCSCVILALGGCSNPAVRRGGERGGISGERDTTSGC